MTRKYNVSQATAEEIGWIGDLEAETYSKRDAIPQDLLEKWYQKNPGGFFILRKSDGQKVGHLDVLPLRAAALLGLWAGEVVESEIQDEDLFSTKERGDIQDLYIESIIISEPSPPSDEALQYLRGEALHFLLGHFILIIRNLCNPQQVGSVYAIGATNDGKKLLKDLGFKVVGPGHPRRDRHDLYAVGLTDFIVKITERCQGMFGALFEEERNILGKKNSKMIAAVSEPKEGREPWVIFSPEDRAGLALSGGGIRSATFNLGLLQALDDLKMLECIDYLSTVSGGGYVGGWWTAWQVREKKRLEAERLAKPKQEAKSGAVNAAGQTGGTEPATKPGPVPKPGPADGPRPVAERLFPPRDELQEDDAVRHLRQFSRFLSPRVGIFETETWNAIVTVLGGLVPSLAGAVAVMVLGLYLWRVLMIVMLGMGWGYSLATILMVTLATLIWGEWSWSRRGRAEPKGKGEEGWGLSVLAGLLYLAETWTFCYLWFGLGDLRLATTRVTVDQLWYLMTRRCFEYDSWYSPLPAKLLELFLIPCLAWVLAAAWLLVLRFFVSRWSNRQQWRPDALAADRVAGWLLKLALGWLACSVVWFAACYLHYKSRSVITLVVGVGASSGWFAWLQKWMSLAPHTVEAPSRGQRLKRLAPQVFAYVAVAAMAVLVARVMLYALYNNHLPEMFAGALATIGMVLLFFSPEAMGQHAFYRARITRTYLGASNPHVKYPFGNLETEERRDDDVNLFETEQAVRPLHLVCCAANDLAGDPLATLSRCARSATLSCHGIAIGEFYAPTPKLKLSSALTASAAAFNSNMGSASKKLGPAGTFLMTALDLRLGLWVPHPLSKRQRMPRLPGWLFFLEMFGETHAGDRRVAQASHADANYLHLSDGGHFENLALYELVRRHCRYIIVSDCGADIEVVFDDFGNAQRRIREDFGVEIEIDLDPLKPGENGLSRQHMVVGTIHYDGVDKGILLYFKPTLTGDEPGDVMQYKGRNTDFPHESTGDQFYDEAQWESYRRLGEHEGREALRFVEKDDKRQPYQVFTTARSKWYPTPPDFEQRLLSMTSKYTDLEKQLRLDGPPGLVREVFPELNTMAGDGGLSNPLDMEDMRKRLHFLLQATQLMEDVWIACRLETHWTHPLNLGWLNYFQRWACTPTYRMWWPVLKPLYSSSLRSFAEEHFGLSFKGQRLYDAKTLSREDLNDLPAGLARDYWESQTGTPTDPKGNWKTRPTSTPGQTRVVYEHVISLTYQALATPGVEPRTYPVQMGLAFVEINAHEGEALWSSDDLFVPPSMWGAGIGSTFLSDIIEDLEKRKITIFRVKLARPRSPADSKQSPTNDAEYRLTDKGSRQELTDLIGFYKIAGFVLEESGNQVMVKYAVTRRAIGPA